MPDNRIDASLSAADSQAVMDAINAIRTKLPFLIDLTPEERHMLPKMGDKSRAFVSKALEIAQQNQDILPRSFNIEEMRRDVELSNALQPIMLALSQLQEMIEDTSLQVGSEAYVAALAVYTVRPRRRQGSGPRRGSRHPRPALRPQG